MRHWDSSLLVKKRLLAGLSALALATLTAVNVGPIALVVRQAFSPEIESVSWPLRLIPARLSVENFTALWSAQTLIDPLALSFWVAVAATAVSLLLGFPAGWAAARSRVWEQTVIRSALLARVFPPIALAISLAALFIPLHLYNHPFGLGLIVAHATAGVPMAMLVSYAFFRDVPRELEDAAHVDGCTPFTAFVRVTLPSASGAIGSASILIFLLSWDELAYALLIQLTNRTLPPLLYYYTEFGQLAQASVLAVLMLIPSALVILTLQQLIARGVFAGSVKI